MNSKRKSPFTNHLLHASYGHIHIHSFTYLYTHTQIYLCIFAVTVYFDVLQLLSHI